MTADARVTIPNVLSALRLAAAPVLLGLAWLGEAQPFLALLVAALATDVADGFLARRLGQQSDLGTRLDSRADLALWLVLPPCAWWLQPDVVRGEAALVALLLASFVLPLALGLLKYGRLTSYHTWGAKLSAWAMGAAVLALFAGGPLWPFRAAAAVVVVAALEEIAITALLPRCESNVRSLVHVMRGLRRGRRPGARQELAQRSDV